MGLSNLVLRLIKGTPLTNTEVDDNFTKLNDGLSYIAADFYGNTDPTTIAGLTVGPGFKWGYKTDGYLYTRDDANAAWVKGSRIFVPALDQILEADIPTSDEGPIYVAGKGPMEWTGAAYTPIGGGAKGGGGNQVFYENDQVVTEDYTITAGKNAGSWGDIQIAPGKNVTVPAGSSWQLGLPTPAKKTHFVQEADPAANITNKVAAGDTWAKISAALEYRRNEANDAWVVESRLFANLSGVSSVGITKNKLINGDFMINQRGTSGTASLAGGAYGYDRWKAGAGGCAYTSSTVNNVTTLNIASGTLVQVIEGLNLQSGTHTLSYTGTAPARINGGVWGVSGMTGTAVGGVNQTIEFGVGTVSLVQYEPGTYGTPFEHLHISVQQVMCSRYFAIGFGGGSSRSGDNAKIAYCQFPIQMRATPSVSTSPATSAGVINSLGFRSIASGSEAGGGVEFTYQAHAEL